MKKISALGFAAGPFIGAALSFISLPFFAWFFSVEDIGRLTMLNFGLSLCAAIFTLQMNQGYVREFHEASDKSGLFWAASTPGLLLSILMLIAYSISTLSISKILFGIDSPIMGWIFILSMFASYANIFFTHALRMEERGVAFAISTVLPRLLLIIFILAMVFLKIKKTFLLLLLLNAASITATFFLFLFSTKESWKPSLGKKIDWKLQKKLLNFSTPLVAGGLAYWGLTMLDRLLLRRYSGFEELGIYAMASSLASVAMVASSSFSNIWHPTVYKWVGSGVGVEKLQPIVDSLLIFVVIMWSGFALASPIMPLFLPNKYHSVQYIIPACAAAPIFYMMSESTGIGIGIQRKTNYSMLASISAFLVCLVLNIISIPIYGAKGAAASLMVAFYVFFIIRTESSNFFWQKIKCKKVYFYLSICFFMSMFSLIDLPKTLVAVHFSYWLFFFLFVLVFERKKIFMMGNSIKELIA